MKRGEIYYANLDTNKKYPALVISNDANNQGSSTVTVIPITFNINEIYPFEVALPAQKSGLEKDAKIQCHQIRTMTKSRIVSFVAGKVNDEILSAVKGALELHLGFV
ncbi:MAG: type II toxin-antitoxin system PemK/MazF family toxin [Gammaproteobacteria bacterium]|nr:MAG: type II toxin-antitoxin system PemK/MazF family toxin [Gammaproteobacteria bacterium]